MTYYLRVLQITVHNMEGHVTSRELWERLVLKLENAMRPHILPNSSLNMGRCSCVWIPKL